jgi:chromodomain-helicase-DNA-binding protein 4
MDVFHPAMYRCYCRKYDMDEPPKLDESIDEMDQRWKRIKEAHTDDPSFEERFYK